MQIDRPAWARFSAFSGATNVLNRYGWYLALASALLIPIKLTLGYFALFPLIFLWLLGGNLNIVRHPIVSRLLIFVAIVGLSGIFGIAPLRTSISSLRLTLSLLAIPAVASVTLNPASLMLAAILGQTVAALASCLEIGFGIDVFPRYFTGAVTESGQLAIIIPISAALILSGKLSSSKLRLATIASVIVMTAALVLNAKRGPFVGCFIGLGLLFTLRSPKLLLPLIATALATILFVPSLHQRLTESTQHFFIAGGRNEMWSIGRELICRYPLGIGFHNSPYLQKFSIEVPPEHSHFHSNFINILVETGWIGFAAFILWYGVTVNASYRLGRAQPLAFGILAALVSWQIAGLVEYNIGDSEVFVPMLIQIGGLLSMLPWEREARWPGASLPGDSGQCLTSRSCIAAVIQSSFMHLLR